jgi:dTMP kinase
VLIALEGLEGVGKTTLARSLERDPGVVYLKSPPEPMNPVRGYISDLNDPRSTFYFYVSGLCALQKEINEHLEGGAFVILDRYLGSTIAYHANGLSFDPPPYDSTQIRRPDCTIYVECDEGLRQKRLARRGFHIFNRTEVDEKAIAHFLKRESDISFCNDDPVSKSVESLRALLSRLR